MNLNPRYKQYLTRCVDQFILFDFLIPDAPENTAEEETSEADASDSTCSCKCHANNINIDPWFHFIHASLSNEIHTGFFEVNSKNQVRANIQFYPEASNLDNYAQVICNGTARLGIDPARVSYWYPDCGWSNFPPYLDIMYEGCGDLKKEYWMWNGLTMNVTSSH